MKRTLIRYRVKAERAADNVQYVEAVFAELVRNAPQGLRYASFKLDDGVSFIHIASVETADGTNPLLAQVAFKAFLSNIAERCDEPPVSVTLHEVGTYRMFES